MNPTEDEMKEEVTREQIEASISEHTHEGDPIFGEVPHLHAMGADWQIVVNVPMTVHADEIDVIDLMEFRRLPESQLERLERNAKAFVDQVLAEPDTEVAIQQMAIIAMNVEQRMNYGLLEVVDSMLEQEGITPPCNLQPIESSSIRSWGYVRESQEAETGYVYVAFVGGGLYRYQNVPKDLVEAWTEAESHGKFFAGEIRNVFTFERVA